MSHWQVYVLRCNDDTFYTGVTTDIQRRIHEHNHNSRAASYTRSRRPVKLVYTEDCEDRSSALKREHGIRQLSRSQKERLIAGLKE